MRVAILADEIPPESSGGAQTIAWALARGLHGLGHDTHVLTTTRGDAFEETREGIATYHLHTAPASRWGSYLSVYNPSTIGPLRGLLERIRPDVVNAHNVQNSLSFFSLMISRRMGFPTIWNSHDLTAIASTRLTHFVDPARRGPLPAPNYRLPPFHDLRRMGFRWNPLRIPLTRAILRFGPHVRLGVSHAHANALMANGIAAVRTVHNGIDTGRFERVRPEAVKQLRDRLGLAGRRVVLFAGRLRREKGSTELIAAMDVLRQRIPDVTLLVLADRGYKPEGRAQKRFPEVFARHVVESGWLAGEELVAAYHLADVVTVPSVYLDPLPTVNLEAMAAGKPVVATCFGGSPEAVLDGETGIIVNPFDTEQFAARLEELLIDPALMQRLGEAGQRRAKEYLSADRYVHEMLGVYREAAQAAGRPDLP